jgi:hypothetical protein
MRRGYSLLKATRSCPTAIRRQWNRSNTTDEILPLFELGLLFLLDFFMFHLFDIAVKQLWIDREFYLSYAGSRTKGIKF